MSAPKLTALVGRKTRKGTTVTAKQFIGSLNDYYDTYLIIQANNSEQISKHIGDGIVAALEEIGLACEGYAKRLCPVDTGRLRNSITHALNVSSGEVVVGTNVEYAPYVELGTYRPKREGAHFLYKAAANHKKAYERILASHIG